MSPCSSLLIRDRPGCRARLFHVQYPRHAVRCQRMTVSGCTITRVERQPGQYRESHDPEETVGWLRSSASALTGQHGELLPKGQVLEHQVAL